MKAVFDKTNNLCIGVIDYCPDGKEAGLVGRKPEDIIVAPIPAEIAEAIMDSSRPETFRNLRLGERNHLTLDPERQPEVLRSLNKKEQDLLFILDENNPLEERFKVLTRYVLKPHIKMYNDINHGKSTDTARSGRSKKDK